jgi:hypothetical protein
MPKKENSVIWKEQGVLDFVGAASSRDRFNSRLEKGYWILWERLPAAIVLIRGWKPLPQVFFLVT